MTSDARAVRRGSAAPSAVNRALDKAYVQAVGGNVPTLIQSELLRDAIHETWHVRSRAGLSIVYTVDLLHDVTGIATLCDCPAAMLGNCCWHRGAARLGHLGAIASINQAPVRYRAKPNTTAATRTVTQRLAS